MGWDSVGPEGLILLDAELKNREKENNYIKFCSVLDGLSTEGNWRIKATLTFTLWLRRTAPIYRVTNCLTKPFLHLTEWSAQLKLQMNLLNPMFHATLCGEERINYWYRWVEIDQKPFLPQKKFPSTDFRYLLKDLWNPLNRLNTSLKMTIHEIESWGSKSYHTPIAVQIPIQLFCFSKISAQTCTCDKLSNGVSDVRQFVHVPSLESLTD